MTTEATPPPQKKRFWHKRRVVKYTIISALLILIFSISPLVLPTSDLTPSQAAQARAGAARIIKPLMSAKEQATIAVTNEQLTAISDTVSYTVPAVQLRLNSSAMGILMATSITTIPGAVYLNAQCMLVPNLEGKLEFNQCRLGSLPLPGIMVEYLFKGIARVFFGEEALLTFNNILANAQLGNDKLVINFHKPGNLKASVEDRITDTFKVIQELRQLDSADTETISLYLDYIQSHATRSDNTAELVGKTFLFAQSRSITEDPVDENIAALWALTMTLGAPEFARIVAMPVDYSLMLPEKFVLRNRMDLRLHFFFSVALRLASEKQLSVNIGKLKEVMDTAQGGSGYSFRDLTADKSGVELADFAISSEDNARRVQAILAGSKDENLFIPLLHDLPEGFSETAFQRTFGSESDERYLAMENTIDGRIAALPLYSDETVTAYRRAPAANADVALNQSDITVSQQWYQVDTHIHTRYSDGVYSVVQIAEQASAFGCDAIAITDHGDQNLKQVLSDTFWQDVGKAANANPNLSIMAGLEWNIPPFAGREHVTVLLPQNDQTPAMLSAFRDQFDHYGKSTPVDIDASAAMQWLNQQYAGQSDSPVIIYNHPSRKDASEGENQHDMENWLQQSPYVIGFSGSPGHQKKRGDDNGSYSFKFKTRHGWDPAIAVVGKDWDALLMSGRQIYAARAPSDFHNDNMDYWPCEFSTTHVRATSNAPRHIMAGFKRGHFWAQHGKFVDALSATLEDSNGKVLANAGDTLSTSQTGLQARLTVNLAAKDWQGFATSLDEVTAVIITDQGVDTRTFYPETGKNPYVFTVPLPPSGSHVAIRWFGRSIQPEQHHYQFFTNAVMVQR